MYGPDPYAFVQWHYDKKRRTIYAMREIYGHKMRLHDIYKKIEAINAHNRYTTSESSEPRSNNEMKLMGMKLAIAKKGPDSVERGETWLGELDKIVIDPSRTPNIAREFENIDFRVDKDGNPLARLVDKENHAIDATRYAFEQEILSAHNEVTRKGIDLRM